MSSRAGASSFPRRDRIPRRKDAMTSAGSTAVSDHDLTDEQRQTLELLNGHMGELLTGFDEVLERYGIHRQIHRFSTVRSRKDDDAPCHMACCSCGPPDEACIENCPQCEEPASVTPEAGAGGAGGTSRPSVLYDSELSDEQRQTLELLNGRMGELLSGFDEVLERYGIERQVHRFSTVQFVSRADEAPCLMMCCRCPPPDDACECSPCPQPKPDPEPEKKEPEL
jgi:hypothetical protein